MDLFCNDETVQSIFESLTASFSQFNQDLSNVDLMSFINTNASDMPATIDQHGNVDRRTQSFLNYVPPQRFEYRQEDKEHTERMDTKEEELIIERQPTGGFEPQVEEAGYTGND